MSSTPAIIDVSQAQPPFFWGIDIGGTGIKIGLVDQAGQTLSYQSIPTRESEGPNAAIERIADYVNGLSQISYSS